MTIKMYPFFQYGARVLLPVIAISYAFYGCSSGPNPVIVPLESTRVAHDDCQKLPRSSAPSIVYSCKSDVGPVFVATLKDCSIPEKFTFQATTRQLLVGVVGAKVARQGPVTLGSLKALQSVVTGTIDAEPVIMSTFTYRKKNCITDIVLWQGVEHNESGQEAIVAFADSSKKLAAVLVNDDLLVQDVTPTEG